MIQSLNKKLQVLDCIVELNVSPKRCLEDPRGEVDEFDQSVEEKSKLI